MVVARPPHARRDLRMVESLVSSFRAQLRLDRKEPKIERKQKTRDPGRTELCKPKPPQRKLLSLTEGRAIGHGHGVYELPRAISLDQADELKRQVDEKYDQRGWTDRGASLSTHDVFVRDLKCKDTVYQAIDACCHAVEKITGNLVTYNRHEVFVIVYDASQQPGLEKHRDGTSKAQRNTVLIALDNAKADYVGGGTRFYPEKPDPTVSTSSRVSHSDSSPTSVFHRKSSTIPDPFAVQPEQGGSVIFPPDLMHEGIPISKGRRHVIAVFTKDGSNVSFNDKQKLRKEQYEAALAFELQAIKESVLNRMTTSSSSSSATASSSSTATASSSSCPASSSCVRTVVPRATSSPTGLLS